MDEPTAARLGTMEAQMDVLRVITQHLAAAMPPERRAAALKAIQALQSEGSQKQWEYGTALEQECARLIRCLS